MEIPFKQAAFYTEGWKQKPLLIVIHWTAGSFKGAIETFSKGLSKASSHYIVDITGDIVQMVKLSDRAWHAGESESKFGKYANQYSIGIELVGPPSFVKQIGWRHEQLDSCLELIEHIKKQIPSITHITDHSTISPGRKIDVKKGIGNDKFPWSDFVAQTKLIDL